MALIRGRLRMDQNFSRNFICREKLKKKLLSLRISRNKRELNDRMVDRFRNNSSCFWFDFLLNFVSEFCLNFLVCVNFNQTVNFIMGTLKSDFIEN